MLHRIWHHKLGQLPQIAQSCYWKAVVHQQVALQCYIVWWTQSCRHLQDDRVQTDNCLITTAARTHTRTHTHTHRWTWQRPATSWTAGLLPLRVNSHSMCTRYALGGATTAAESKKASATAAPCKCGPLLCSSLICLCCCLCKCVHLLLVLYMLRPFRSRFFVACRCTLWLCFESRKKATGQQIISRYGQDKPPWLS